MTVKKNSQALSAFLQNVCKVIKSLERLFGSRQLLKDTVASSSKNENTFIN